MEMTSLSVGMVAAAATLSGVSTGAAAHEVNRTEAVANFASAAAPRQVGAQSTNVLAQLAAAKPSPFYILYGGPGKTTDPVMAQA